MRLPAFLRKNATWLIGLTVTLAVILVPLILLRPQTAAAPDTPLASLLTLSLIHISEPTRPY